MKKLLSSLVLAFAFYFVMENPGDYPGTKIITIFTGYESKSDCEMQRMEMQELVKAFGIPTKFSLCEVQKDA